MTDRKKLVLLKNSRAIPLSNDFSSFSYTQNGFFYKAMAENRGFAD